VIAYRATLEVRWRTSITSPPAWARPEDIVRATLVLTHFEHGYIT
jgi:hypothetical protein